MTTENLAYDLEDGAAFIGAVQQANGDKLSLSITGATDIAQDTDLMVYGGPDENNLEALTYHEDGDDKALKLTIASGATMGQLKLTDVNAGDFFRLKLESAVCIGILGTLIINK